MHGEKHKRVECGEEWVTHNTRNNKSGKVCKSCLEELPSEGDKGWRTLGNANVPNVRFMSLFLAFPEGYLHSRSRCVYIWGDIKLIGDRNCGVVSNFTNTIFATQLIICIFLLPGRDVRQELPELGPNLKGFSFATYPSTMPRNSLGYPQRQMQMSAECWQLFHFATLPGLGFAVVILRCANVKLIDAKPRARGVQRPQMPTTRTPNHPTISHHPTTHHFPIFHPSSPCCYTAWHANVARSN